MASTLPLTGLAPVIAHVVAVFGDEQKDPHWLSTPLALFDNQTPTEILATSDGIDLVKRTLTRIETALPGRMC